MPYLNKVFLMGNLTRDPELRQVAGGMAICSFGIAVNRQFQSARGETREETCFVEIETWGKSAEIVSQYMRKGRPVFVEGRLRYDQWDDRETGKKRSRLTVRADRIQFVDSAAAGQNGAPQENRTGYAQPQGAPAYGPSGYEGSQPSRPAAPSYQQGYQQPPQPAPSMPAFEGMPEPAADDDIPF